MEYASIFSMWDMDLGKTSLVKHNIRLMDNTPFKEYYQCIPLGMHEEVWEYLKEMLEIGVIWLCYSLWGSPVALVWKKDGKLWFFTVLRKLNTSTIKYSYSLPGIEDIQDSFKWGHLVNCTGPQVGLLGSQDRQGIPTINGIHCRSTWILWMWLYAFLTSDWHSHFLEADGNMSWWPSAQLVSHLSWWHHYVFWNTKGIT